MYVRVSDVLCILHTPHSTTKCMMPLNLNSIVHGLVPDIEYHFEIYIFNWMQNWFITTNHTEIGDAINAMRNGTLNGQLEKNGKRNKITQMKVRAVCFLSISVLNLGKAVELWCSLAHSNQTILLLKRCLPTYIDHSNQDGIFSHLWMEHSFLSIDPNFEFIKWFVTEISFTVSWSKKNKPLLSLSSTRSVLYVHISKWNINKNTLKI